MPAFWSVISNVLLVICCVILNLRSPWKKFHGCCLSPCKELSEVPVVATDLLGDKAAWLGKNGPFIDDVMYDYTHDGSMVLVYMRT